MSPNDNNDNYSPPAKVGALAEAATKEARNIAEFGSAWIDPDLERARREFFGEAETKA